MAQQKAKPKTTRVVTKHDVAKKSINIVPKTAGQEAYLKALGTAEQTVVFGPSGCKSGDTIVHYRRGKRNSSRSLPLKDFVSKYNGGTDHVGRKWDRSIDTYVQSYNEETNRVFYNKVEGAWETGFKHSVKITTFTHGDVKITLDDSVLLHDGTFKKAGEVVVGDWLLCKGDMNSVSKGSSLKKATNKKRIVVEGLKYYTGGWNKSVVSNGIRYDYRRNHKARLVLEADANGVSLDEYVLALRTDPEHTYNILLQDGVEVHHIDGDVTNDEVSNLKKMTKSEHATLHSDDNVGNFNRNYTEVALVKSTEDLGVIEVFDLTMKAPFHNFVVNDGIIAHNTGKTYLAASLAASLYYVKKINKIVITRPHVAVGEKLGFLPGDLREKTEPWALPVLDVLDEHLGKGTVDTGIKNGNIEIAPLALMRGRSFSNAFIICDEAQNLTLHELKMLLTRVGEDSKLVVNGDVMQSDLKEADGLTQIVKLIEKYDLPIAICELGVEDIVRSAMTKMWVETFMKEGI